MGHPVSSLTVCECACGADACSQAALCADRCPHGRYCCSSNRCVVKAVVAATQAVCSGCLHLLATLQFAASQVPVKRREPHPKFCMAALQQIMLPEALGFRPCDRSHDCGARGESRPLA